jgi:hypothetical protein
MNRHNMAAIAAKSVDILGTAPNVCAVNAR